MDSRDLLSVLPRRPLLRPVLGASEPKTSSIGLAFAYDIFKAKRISVRAFSRFSEALHYILLK